MTVPLEEVAEVAFGGNIEAAALLPSRVRPKRDWQGRLAVSEEVAAKLIADRQAELRAEHERRLRYERYVEDHAVQRREIGEAAYQKDAAHRRELADVEDEYAGFSGRPQTLTPRRPPVRARRPHPGVGRVRRARTTPRLQPVRMIENANGPRPRRIRPPDSTRCYRCRCRFGTGVAMSFTRGPRGEIVRAVCKRCGTTRSTRSRREATLKLYRQKLEWLNPGRAVYGQRATVPQPPGSATGSSGSGRSSHDASYVSGQHEPGKRARSTGYYQRQRRRARQRDGHQCVVCGSTLNLETDHIDGDPTNHALDNLRSLCSLHHHQRHGHNKPIEKPRPAFYKRFLEG